MFSYTRMLCMHTYFKGNRAVDFSNNAFSVGVLSLLAVYNSCILKRILPQCLD